MSSLIPITLVLKVYIGEFLVPRMFDQASKRATKQQRSSQLSGRIPGLGLAWVLPNVILLASDYFEMRVLEMGFNIRSLAAFSVMRCDAMCESYPKHWLSHIFWPGP